MEKCLFLFILVLSCSFANPLDSSSVTFGTKVQLSRYEPKKYAYLTILYNDEMAAAVHVLQSSLLSVKSGYELTALVTPSVSQLVRNQFKVHGIHLVEIPEVTITNEHATRSGKIVQHRWRKNLTKIWLWKMTQFEKVVYIDADCLVVQNIDHLFECMGPICAGINTPIPDKFNTGLMVFKPDERVFEGMSEEWNHIGFFEDVEQGLLNHYYPLTNFRKEQILPFKYNAFAYCEDKNVLETTDDVYVIHFLRFKPWRWENYPQGDLGFVWRQYYDALPESFKEEIHFSLYGLMVFPLVLMLVVYLGIDHKTVGRRILKRVTMNWMSTCVYLFIAFGCEGLGYFIAFQLVPFITNPLLAWVIVYEWALFFFLIPVVLWTSVNYVDEIRNTISFNQSLPEEFLPQRHPIVYQILRYWRFFVLILVIQPFLTIFMNFYYHTANPETAITLRCVIMFLTVTVPLHLLGAIFACLVPKISRRLASEAPSLREISKL